jgi:hypothetical protein
VASIICQASLVGQLCTALELPEAVHGAVAEPTPPPEELGWVSRQANAYSRDRVEVEVEVVDSTIEEVEDGEEAGGVVCGGDGEDAGGGGSGGRNGEEAGGCSGGSGGGGSRHHCLHPTDLRIRRRKPEQNLRWSEWQTWRAEPKAERKAEPSATNHPENTAGDAVDVDNNTEANTDAYTSIDATAGADAATERNASHFKKIKKGSRASSFAAVLVWTDGLCSPRQGCRLTEETRVPIAFDDVASTINRQCSPRHGISFTSRNEGSNCG